MVCDARGELAVLAIGVLLWVGSTFAAGEMGRALSGGGMVFTAIGSVLVALAIVTGNGEAGVTRAVSQLGDAGEALETSQQCPRRPSALP